MRPSFCKHFSGLMNETCEKGHLYNAFKQRGISFMSCIPCRKAKDGSALCPDWDFPSDAEIAERDAEIKQSHWHWVEAMQRIAAMDTGKNPAGFVECPKCKGKLN